MTSADAAGQDANKPAAGAAAGGPPPPPMSPPPPPPSVPPRPAGDPYPDVAAAPAAEQVVGVSVRVSKRLLWIGDAYYPLRNIARVYTLTIRPRRKEAVLRFLKRLLITGFLVTLLAVTAAFMEASSSSGFGGSSESSGASVLLTFTLLIGAGANIYFFVDMMKVLGAPPRFVLAVETSGASTAVIGGPPEPHLRQLADQISDAIENPAAEFEVRIDTLTVNPQHYYFGDNVNMYGGTGNVGVAS